jgi:hypothetical protein
MNDTPREQTAEEVSIRLLKQQIEQALLQVIELMNLAYRAGYQVRFEVVEVANAEGVPSHHVLKSLRLFREY